MRTVSVAGFIILVLVVVSPLLLAPFAKSAWRVLGGDNRGARPRPGDVRSPGVIAARSHRLRLCCGNPGRRPDVGRGRRDGGEAETLEDGAAIVGGVGLEVAEA